MNRRGFLSICASAPLARCAAPREIDAPPHALRAAARGLPDHLRALAARALRIRRRALDRLTTAEAIRRRQAWVGETLWRLAGGMPERSALALRVTGELVRPGYRVEKLVYESRPGLHVTALLYLPTDRRGPCAGVLFQAGHLNGGKGAAPYQRACQALVKLGHVVLAFDPAGEGERVYYPRPDGPGTRLGCPDEEHDRTGIPMLLCGDTQTGLMLWDAVRSLDVLAARPEVDPRRLASTGHSGGGTLTMLLAAVDDRLAAAAISCANTQDVASAGFDPPCAVDDAEQDLIGSGPAGFDRWDLLYPLAPKPLLVLVSTRDPFTTYSPGYLVNGREQVGRLARAYATLGAPDHLRWVESDEPHGLSDHRRVEIARWLGRFLLGEPAGSADEPQTAPEPEEVTWVVPGGNVVRALGGKRPLDLSRERLASHPAPERRADLEALLGRVRPAPGRAAVVLDTAPARGCEVELLEVEPAPSVRIPARLFRPTAPRSVLIALGAGGEDDDAWQALAREGYAVCAADLRGTGALRPELGPGAGGYARGHDVEQSFAWASLILGESLVAQRVADVLALVEGLSRHALLAGRPLALAAQEARALPALFAAALDPRIALVYLDGGLASYRSVLDAEDPSCPLAGIVPGVLACTDLPAVAAAARARVVILAGPVDGAGRPMALADARALYGGAANVRILADRGWGFGAIRSLFERGTVAS